MISRNALDIGILAHHFLDQVGRVEVGIEPHRMELSQFLARLVEQLPVAFGRPAVRNQDAHQPMR